MVTTPMLYFAASTLCNSGIQVTGSHNPKDYNGFKMVLGGRAIYGDDIQALRRMMESSGWDPAPVPGKVRNINVLAPTDRIKGEIRLARPLKIVVDCGNGVAGASAPTSSAPSAASDRDVQRGGRQLPNHHPDPSKPENLRDLIAKLKETGADLGSPSTATATAGHHHARGQQHLSGPAR